MYVFQILRDVWEHKASVIYSRLHMELGVCHKLSIPDKTHIWVIDYLISHGVKYMVHIWLTSLSLVRDRNGQMGQKPGWVLPLTKTLTLFLTKICNFSHPIYHLCCNQKYDILLIFYKLTLISTPCFRPTL